VTVSLGVVTLHQEEDFEAALERADFCLYQSKRSGRNRVTVG
jgi:PleD family two-component response regulator